jgi:EAL domain-containing protein (putative c-di-GMP-specific phosphodiesterase class I)
VGSADNAAHVAGEIARELSNPYDVEGYELVVTPSIGISLFPADGTELPVLIRNADAAMYHSKAMGRNQCSFFKEEMNARISERLTLENSMRRGLAREEFYLEYQPIYALGAGQPVVGAEALLRWRHPDLGIVPPARFIPIAEDSGLILDIGEWVIREACRQSRAWTASGLREIPVRVNLSGIQLRQKNLLDVLQRAMQDYGRTPAQIEFEVTESVLLSEVEMATGVLDSLSRQGFRLAIDDFGTGYSSLSYLKRLHVDKLKVDKTFIRDISVDERGAALTRGIIGLAKSLKLRVVAEGVETARQLDVLIDAGCDEAQGYYFSVPLGPMELAGKLRESRP